ncbi:MAG TPA: acetyltransferase [Leptolyngbyaceae cyanobacterium]
MLLKTKDGGTLLEIADVQALINPSKNEVTARDQEGQEEQAATAYSKDQLIFPSGEELPRCWRDANYTKA